MKTSFDAVAFEGSVYVFAVGTNPTTGYKNHFHKTLVPTALTFVQEPPHGPALDLETAFAVDVHFADDSGNPPLTATVTDSAGAHLVEIRRGKDVTDAEEHFLHKLRVRQIYLPNDARIGRTSKGVNLTYYERPLAVYDDQTSQHCTTECTRVEEIDHTGIKTCTAYRTVCQHIRNHLIVTVQVATAQDIATAVENALGSAATAGALAAVSADFVAPGEAGLAAAETAFVAVLTDQLSKTLNNLLRVTVVTRSEWV